MCVGAPCTHSTNENNEYRTHVRFDLIGLVHTSTTYMDMLQNYSRKYGPRARTRAETHEVHKFITPPKTHVRARVACIHLYVRIWVGSCALVCLCTCVCCSSQRGWSPLCSTALEHCTGNSCYCRLAPKLRALWCVFVRREAAVGTCELTLFYLRDPVGSVVLELQIIAVISISFHD